jgi:hypothetical protein
MSLFRESGYDDQQLVRYLLRLLPDDETERLDEMSIADEAVAWRLRLLEDDLVDAYVRGTLAGETLARFESFYLSSERRRRKVEFAKSFAGPLDRRADRDNRDDRNGRSGPLRAVGTLQDRPPAPAASPSALDRIVSRSMVRWGLAAAAALLLVASGGLALREVQLRSGLHEAQRASAALDRRANELEQQLEGQRFANAATVKELEQVRVSIAQLAQQSAARPSERTEAPQTLSTIALVLLPQTRSVGPITTLTIPRGTDRVRFELRLESNRYAQYQVLVKDPATSDVVWRSPRITPMSTDDAAAVSAIVPASTLKAQHYSLEVSGVSSPTLAAQVAGSYAVRIVR